MPRAMTVATASGTPVASVMVTASSKSTLVMTPATKVYQGGITKAAEQQAVQSLPFMIPATQFMVPSIQMPQGGMMTTFGRIKNE